MNKIRQVSIVFFRKEGEILLAMKKRGFGKGLWNGTGGKQKENEDIRDTAKREAQEEVGLTPKNLRKAAIVNFYFPEDLADLDNNQQAHVFFCEDWTGKLTETEEMKPKWFQESDIPYEKMWSGDVIWLPKILHGEIIEADVWFNRDGSVLKHSFRPLL